MNRLEIIRRTAGLSQVTMASRLGMTTRALQYQEARDDPSPVWVLAAEMVALRARQKFVAVAAPVSAE
jgi:DNA-binding XRE family transcriptional regulator